MILKELMRANCKAHSLTRNARISEVAELMREKRVGSIVIVDASNAVEGIITDRDIAMTLALGAGTPDSFVTEAMTTDVKTIYESLSLFDATQHFRHHQVKRMPVVDTSRQLKGMVSVDDLMAVLAREMFDTCSALQPKLGHFV